MRALLAVLVLAAPAVAHAQATVTCEPAEADVVEIDGMLDDWSGVKPIRVGGTAKDASYDLRCLVAGSTLWLSADIRDERVMRTPGGGGDDSLQVSLGKGLVIVVRPGVDRTPPARTVGGKPAPKWLGVEDTLQPAGWSVELAVPIGKIPGWAESPAIATTLRDGDIPKGKTTENLVEWSGVVAQAGKVDQRAAFLADARLTEAAVIFDDSAELDRSAPGKERVVVAGDRVALVGERFAYVALPVARATDVVKANLVELRGDGSKAIAVTLRLRSGDAIRDLVMLWGGDRGRLVPLGGFEIGRSRGDRRLRSGWKVVAGKPWARQTGGARRVIEVRAEPAAGWDEDSYDEPRATDAEPIHVPWDDDRIGGVLWLGASGALEAAPIRR